MHGFTFFAFTLAISLAALSPPLVTGAYAQRMQPDNIHPCTGLNCPIVHTIGFDDGTVPVGGAVTSQFQGQGVYFADPLVNGFQYGAPAAGTNLVDAAACGSGLTVFVPGAGLTSSQPDAAEFGSCGSLEFPSHGTFAMFTSGVSDVSASVGDVASSGDFFELDAYDQHHELLGSTVVAAGRAGLLTGISYSAPAGQYVWAFALYTRAQGAGAKIGFDDLSYSVPKGQAPAISLVTAHTALYAIVPSSGSLALSVNRFNGSTGEVDLSASGMPAGVTVSFSPSVLTGTQSQVTLQWQVGISAYGGTDAFHPAISTLAVDAAPAVASAGASPAAPVPITLSVSLAFGWRPSLPAPTVADCQTVPYYDSGGPIFEPPSDISGTGTFAVSGAGPGTGLAGATLSSGTFANGSSSPTLTLSTGSGTPVQDTTLVLSASAPGYATQTATLLVHRIVGRVSSWTTASGGNGTALDAPHWGQSYEINIDGSGFCPGTKVAFGEYGSPPSVSARSPALVTPSFISSDGTQLDVTVPHYAANGPIDIVAPGGSFSSSTHFSVDDVYSATDGFDFANRAGPAIGLSDLADVFPQSEVYVQVDPCSGLTFGLINCSLASTGIGTPQADFFLDNGGSAVAQGGQCYGFSTASLYLSGIAGEPNGRSPQTFDADASDVNQIADNANLDNYILDQQISQDSSQTESLVGSAKSAAASDTAAQLESRLRTDLVTTSGYLQPVVVDMFATVNGKRSGHSVVAYDVQGTGGGNFDIFVYNPNNPYNSSVSGDSAKATANWVSNQQNSVIHVQADGSWTFPELSYSGTLSSGNLYLLPSFSLPTSFDLPGSFSFGNILAAVPPSTRLLQVADARGHRLLVAGGDQDMSSSGIAGARVVYSVTDAEPAVPHVLLPAGGTYTVTLAPASVPTKTAGAVSGGLIGPAGLVSVSGRSTGPIRLGFAGPSGATTLQVPSGARALTEDIALTARNGADRTATLEIAPGATGTLGASWTKAGALALVDRGGSAALQVDLGASGAEEAPAGFVTPLLHLRAHATLQLRPADWSHLASAKVLLTSNAGGKLRVTRLHSRFPVPGITRARVSTRSSKVATAFRLQATVVRAGGRATTSVTWLVTNGKKVVASHRQAISLRQGHATGAWALRGLHRGSYRVVANLVVARATAPGSLVASSAQRSAVSGFTVP